MDGDGNEVIDDAEKEKDDDYVTFPYEKVIKKSNKRSLAWEFFEFRGKSLKEGPIEKEVYCKLCSCKVPYDTLYPTTHVLFILMSVIVYNAPF